MTKQTSISILIMRVIGMIYVTLGNHYLPCYFPGFITSAVGQFFGFIGVGMFFAVSGYIFGCKSKTDNTVGTGDWLVKRLERIIIPYWFILALVIAVRWFRRQSITWTNIVASVLNLQGILQLRYAFPELGHTWFISILMVCYCLMCVWTRYRDNSVFWKTQWIVYLAVILIFAVNGQVTSASYTGSVLLTSIMYYLGYYGEEKVNSGGVVQHIAVMIAILGLRAISWYLFDDTLFYIIICTLGGIISAVAYFQFIVTVTRMMKITHVPKVVRALNDISYEFYLTHALFICGSTSLVGIMGKHPTEILVLILLAGFTSIILKKMNELTREKG